jgi:hypothetical protein
MQIWQHGAVIVAAWREFHSPDVRRGRVHGQMHLAPLASALNAVRSGLPLAITEKLDPSVVHQQVQVTLGPPIRDLDYERLLPMTQRRLVGHGPVQLRHLPQAGHHPGRLPKRQFEQNLDRQAELDRGVREHRRATGLAIRRRGPDHILVQPDQKRPALAELSSIAGPVRREVAGGLWLAHQARLTEWIRNENPPRLEFCNNACRRAQRLHSPRHPH